MRRPAGRNSVTEPAFSSQANCEYGFDVPSSIDSPSIDSMASLDLPPFRPRFPWWGADLQTIAILLSPFESDLSPHTSERVCFCMADRSGDILVGMLDRPAEPVVGHPLVILVHGLTGCENSSYMRNAARHLLRCGYRVLRLNLPVCGAPRPYFPRHRP